LLRNTSLGPRNGKGLQGTDDKRRKVEGRGGERRRQSKRERERHG